VRGQHHGDGVGRTVDENLRAAEGRTQDGCDHCGHDPGGWREAGDKRIGHCLGDGKKRDSESGDKIAPDCRPVLTSNDAQQRKDSVERETSSGQMGNS
jgi:hypothetical protein